MELLAIIIPHHLLKFSEEQEKNIESCFLRAPKGAHFFFLLPKGLDASYYKTRFPTAKFLFIKDWLNNFWYYNQLNISSYFYLLFRNYKWILVFEPDAFLYKTDLNDYFRLPYDYWGAPWVDSSGETLKWIGVGNSGFSLRRTSVFLRYFKVQDILSTFIKAKKKKECILITYIRALLKLASATTYSAIPNPKASMILHDGFWSSNAYDDYYRTCCSMRWRLGLFLPLIFWKIKFPRPSLAAKFSIETNPRWALAKAKVLIPTGSHALVKYDSSLHQELLGKITSQPITVFCHEAVGWERDYIRDLFSGVAQCHFVFWKNLADITRVENKTCAIAFNSLKLNYDEAKLAVEMVNPKIVIHCRDEDGKAQNWFLGRQKFLYLKQYSHGRFYRPSFEKIQLPLGFMANSFKEPPFFRSVRLITEKTLPWAFIGNIKQDREEMLKEFSTHMPTGKQVTDGSLSPDLMVQIYDQAIFVPNGRGHINLDCFRLYEAILSGCIPVIVSTLDEFNHTFNYNGDPPPFLIFPNWKMAAIECKRLLSDIEKLQKFQLLNLQWLRRKIVLIRNLITLKINHES